MGMPNFAREGGRLESVEVSGPAIAYPSVGSSQERNRGLRLYPRSNGSAWLVPLLRLRISILNAQRGFQ